MKHNVEVFKTGATDPAFICRTYAITEHGGRKAMNQDSEALAASPIIAIS